MICPRCQSTVVEKVPGQRTAVCKGCGHSAHVTRFRDPLEAQQSQGIRAIDSPFHALQNLFPKTEYLVDQPGQEYEKRAHRIGAKR